MPSGGKRKGAGAKPMAMRLGRPKHGRKNIRSFFGNVPPEPVAAIPAVSEISQGLEPNVDEPTTHQTIPPKMPTTNVTVNDRAVASGKMAATADPSKDTYSGILASQMTKLTQNKECMDEAIKRVQDHNELWQRGKDFVHQTSVKFVDLPSCWTKFYQYDVFTWRPDLIIPQWRPKCVSCRGPDIRIKASNRRPRFIYSLEKNYLLHSPIQWECIPCSKMNAKESAEDTTPNSTRTQYFFTSHHPTVLSELEASHPGVYELFPCFLSKGAGLDKRVMELCVNASLSGMGATAVHKLLEVFHWQHWQAREALFLEFILARFKAPLFGENAKELQSCILSLTFPAYDSREICGQIPSEKYLLEMYSLFTAREEQWMDSLHQRRLQESKILSLDCSYKVPKWLTNVRGKRMYPCLVTGKNEYLETIMCYFTQSDNFAEIGSALTLLRQGGFSPEFAFTDNPFRDVRLLEEKLPSLRSEAPEMPVASTDDLPLLRLREDPLYLNNGEQAIAALRLFEEAVDSSGDKAISFDIEYSVYAPGEFGKTAIITMASLVYPNVLVFHLAKMARQQKEFLNRFKAFVGRTDLTFAGNRLPADVTRLKKDFPSVGFHVPRCLDTAMMAAYRGASQYAKGQLGLDVLCEKLVKCTLPKDDNIRKSDVWDRDGRLSKEAELYAARDAEAGILVYHELVKLPDLATRLSQEQVEVGTAIDIMPHRKFSLDPIASGRIVKIDGDTKHGTKLNGNSRILVEVTIVYRPECLMLSTEVSTEKANRRCKCGKRGQHGRENHGCNMRTFGQVEQLVGVPFKIIEDRKRLRLHRDMSTKPQAALERNNERGLDFPPLVVPAEGEEERPDCNDEEEDVVINLSIPESVAEELDLLIQDEDHNEGPQLDCLAGIEMDVDADAEMDDPLEDLEDGGNDCTSLQEFIDESTKEIVAEMINKANAAARSIRHDIDNAVQHNVTKIIRRVLGDAFHFMDRVKVPVHHDWKAAFFSALRDAVFIYDEGDKKMVERVLERHGKKWSKVARYNFRYIVRRVRRMIPPPKELHARVKVVFDYFMDKEDSATNKPLFNHRARETANKVLQALERGELSDPAGVSFYTQVITSNQEPKADKDGLPLWRCLRGTNAAECSHAQYTRAFGQVRAGPVYSVAVLKHHHHRQSWRASENYRPGFPRIHHYNARLVDAINGLHIELFRRPKYNGWPGYDEAGGVTYRSPFGILPLLEETSRKSTTPCQFLRPTERYLASAQASDLPHTPVATKDEKILFKQLIEKQLKDGVSMTARDTFVELAREWNSKHVVLPSAMGENVKIYPKYIGQLIKQYKDWRAGSKKKASIDHAMADPRIKALQYNRGVAVASPMQPAALLLIRKEDEITETGTGQPSQNSHVSSSKQDLHIRTHTYMDDPVEPQKNPEDARINSQNYHAQCRTGDFNTHSGPRPWTTPAPWPPPLLRLPPPPMAIPNPSFWLTTRGRSDSRPGLKRGRMVCKKCNNKSCRRPFNRRDECSL